MHLSACAAAFMESAPAAHSIFVVLLLFLLLLKSFYSALSNPHPRLTSAAPSPAHPTPASPFARQETAEVPRRHPAGRARGSPREDRPSPG